MALKSESEFATEALRAEIRNYSLNHQEFALSARHFATRYLLPKQAAPHDGYAAHHPKHRLVRQDDAKGQEAVNVVFSLASRVIPANLHGNRNVRPVT